MASKWYRAATFATLAAFSLLSTAVAATGAERTRKWQDGKWGDTATTTAGAVAVPLYGGGAMALPLTATTYIVETETLTYVGLWRKHKSIPMTVNAPVRFAIEKDKLYVVGEDAKEYELKLTKKILKTP